MKGFNFSLHYPFNKTHRFVSVLENRDNIYFKMFYLKVLVVCEKEIPLLQVSKHEDDSDTTLSLPCVFLAIPFPSRWVSVCLCVCVDCVLATWLSSAATFGFELRLYLLTQNTDKVSNLFSLRESLPLPVTAFILYHIQKMGANANLDSVGGTKNTLHQMTPTALGSCTCCAMFALHRKSKNLQGWVQTLIRGCWPCT